MNAVCWSLTYRHGFISHRPSLLHLQDSVRLSFTYISVEQSNSAALILTCPCSSLAKFTCLVLVVVTFCSVQGLCVSTVWLQRGSRTQTWWPALAAQRARPATTGLCLSPNTAFSVSFHHNAVYTAARCKDGKMAVLFYLFFYQIHWSFVNHMQSDISFWCFSSQTCFQLYRVVSFTVLYRHSFKSFPAALC